MFRSLAVVLAAVALFVSAATAADSGANIVAGGSAGGVRLGADVAEAVSVLGSVFDQSDRDKFSVYDWPLKPFLVVTDRESGKIVLVLIQLSEVYKTDKGSLTAGSDRTVVEATYGKEFTTDEDRRTTTLVYDPLGIAFDIGKNGVMTGRVVSIIVFMPGQWKTITASL
jgi:hypothetical protein